MIMHKHHKIPRHAGGTDSPDNLVLLTVAEHAEAHRVLYEQYGRWQDEVAWKALSGMIGKEELIKRLQSEGGKKVKPSGHSESVRQARLKAGPHSKERKKKISLSLTGKKQSFETVQKRIKANTGKKHKKHNVDQKGGKNPNAKSIILQGVHYSSIKEAVNATGLTRYQISLL